MFKIIINFLTFYYLLSRQALQGLIAERPDESVELHRIIDEVYNEFKSDEEETDDELPKPTSNKQSD